jgi:hypothetical protein
MDDRLKKIISELENETGLKVSAIERYHASCRNDYELHFMTPKSDYVIYILSVTISAEDGKWYVYRHAQGYFIRERFEEIVDTV